MRTWSGEGLEWPGLPILEGPGPSPRVPAATSTNLPDTVRTDLRASRRSVRPTQDADQLTFGEAFDFLEADTGDRDQRLELALRVASGTRGFTVTADNRFGAWAQITKLVDSGSAFAVEPQSSLLVLDYDLAGCSASEKTRRRRGLDRVRSALTAAGIPLIEVSSGRAGHKHVFARIGSADRTARTALEDFCRRAGLDVRTTGVRPPMTPHRSGEIPKLVTPATAPEAIAVLELPAGTADQLRDVCARLGLGGLSSRMRRLLREGYAAAGYESASHGRMALAVAVFSAGYAPDYLLALLNDRSNKLGESFRGRPAAWQAAEIARLEQKAKARLSATALPTSINGRDEAHAHVTRWKLTLPSGKWAGMSGSTDLAVAEGIGRLARAAGGPVFSASLPAVALAGGVSRDTARRALKRLQTAGWLRQIEAATPTMAARFRLRVPDELQQIAGPVSRYLDVEDPDAVAVELRSGNVAEVKVGAVADTDPLDEALVVDLASDLARWAGIGKSAARVLRELASEAGHTVADIAQRLGVTTNAVRLQLRKLAGLGLAVKNAAGWVRGKMKPTRVVEDLGVGGKRAAQAEADELARRYRAALRDRWRAAYQDAVDMVRSGDESRTDELAATFGPKVFSDMMSRIRRRVRRATND